MKGLPRICATVVALAVSACTFEHNSNLVAPSVPSLPSVPSPTGGSDSLLGLWASESGLTLPASWSCGNFQWSITEQTPTLLSGEFTALCAGVVVISGSALGQRNGEDVHLDVNGTAVVQGITTCPFTLDAQGHIEGDSIRIPYAGETCLGPLHGEEVLRRPSSGSAPPSHPAPEPSPGDNAYHVGPGPLSAARAEQVVRATGEEFAYLRAPRATESEAVSAAEELLLRTIWHLRLAGFTAGRQRNPSGAISNDKLTAIIDGTWRAYDIFYDYGRAHVETQVIFFEVSPANPIDYPGLPD